MHSFAMNAWDAARGRLVMGAWQMHYGLENLRDIKVPPGAPESWWEYHPARGPSGASRHLPLRLLGPSEMMTA